MQDRFHLARCGFPTHTDRAPRCRKIPRVFANYPVLIRFANNVSTRHHGNIIHSASDASVQQTRAVSTKFLRSRSRGRMHICSGEYQEKSSKNGTDPSERVFERVGSVPFLAITNGNRLEFIRALPREQLPFIHVHSQFVLLPSLPLCR